MIYLSQLTDVLSISLDKAAITWLLPFGCIDETPFLQLLLVSVIVLHRSNVSVQRHMKVVVEIGAIRADPWKRPAHTLFVCSDLGDGRAGYTDKGRVT